MPAGKSTGACRKVCGACYEVAAGCCEAYRRLVQKNKPAVNIRYETGYLLRAVLSHLFFIQQYFLMAAVIISADSVTILLSSG